ncbi:(2Fe-2S)-binding protein [Halodurantibacterium flavum]|uniref:(2Fe-2S)-binding protein n=1 Tax=Halodurantibacterium flavum TaxID=1382802 RepID=A0ABW4S1M3_9RHOB
MKFTVNGRAAETDAPEDTPLLWVLREELGLVGTKYGCGVAACGACTIHLNGVATRSCVTPVSMAEDAEVVTIEGLANGGDHPLVRAWVAEQVPQCGYCQSGQIMQAADLLAINPQPTREEIRSHMAGNICRCGTYSRIERAIERASREG